MTIDNCPQEIARLINTSIHSTATHEQLTQLESWLNKNESNRKFYEQLQNQHYRLIRLQEFSQYDSHKDWFKIRATIHRKKRSRLLHLLPYAALVILALGIGGIVLYQPTTSPYIGLPLSQQTYPETFKARLILEDGQTIELENTVPLKSIKGERFINNGQLLTYQLADTSKKVRWHILQVPRGGEYRIILADGTKVWLNADSELRYPDRFDDYERKVELTGEAYFEVSKDARHPFHVITQAMEIKVLGTSFNVSAYTNETLHTTLVEGKVAINAANREIEIYPGQQASLNQGKLSVHEVKVNNYIGWKEQRFIYEDKLLGEVIRDLERWYDVKIDPADSDIINLHFTANLPKYARIDQVAEIIEYAACVKFEIKDNKIIVRKDK